MIKIKNGVMKLDGDIILLMSETSSLIDRMREYAIEHNFEKQFVNINTQILLGVDVSNIKDITENDANSEYFVFIEGAGMPTVKHKSYDEANAELERLLMIKNNAGRTGYVCKIDMAKKSVIEVKEVGDL